MAEITRFTHYPKLNQLKVELDNQTTYSYTYEYLRVFSPSLTIKKQGGKEALVSHKKMVKLLRIESVAKHGYRFIFDDNHSDIFNTQDLILLAQEHDMRWEHYLAKLKESGQNREAMINFTEVK